MHRQSVSEKKLGMFWYIVCELLVKDEASLLNGKLEICILAQYRRVFRQVHLNVMCFEKKNYLLTICRCFSTVIIK